MLGQSGELIERSCRTQIGDSDVVAHVDHLLPCGLRVPDRERVAEALAPGLDAEVDVTGRSAKSRRGLPALDVVDRHGAPERHVEMRVGIDAARQHEPSTSIDRAVGFELERLADPGDPFALDEDVRNVIVRRGHDATALDQDRHECSFLSIPRV